MSPANAPQQKQWFGHPRGLATLFFTEMWERLGYYGMRAILLLFMVAAAQSGGLGFDDATGGAIYGLYTATAYLMALPGGWVADRLLGQRSAVFWGGVVISAGYLTMGLPAISAFEGFKLPLFFIGLVLVAVGTGLLKPNVSAMVGSLYADSENARRDAGFSIFYMGINLGAFIGPIACGYLGEKIDWHLGFAFAGFGMILGLIQYRLGAGYLTNIGDRSAEAGDPIERRANLVRLLSGLGTAAVIVLGLYLLRDTLGLTMPAVAQGMGVVIVGVALAYFGYVLFFGGLNREERNHVLVIILFFFGAAMFWSGFEQAGSSMSLFASRYTDLTLFGWEVPASWFQSVNAIFIILLAPVAGWTWIKLGKHNPSAPAKFGIGLVFLGLGFVWLAWGSSFLQGELAKVGMSWLVITYLLHTIGELCLSPVGLSNVTKLSPKRFVGQMMGIWFLGSSLGNLIAGLSAGLLESMPMPKLFGTVAGIAIVAGTLFLVFTPLIKKLIGEPKHA
jgi:POT family proton-dependent oligopeptide transporter